MKRLFILISFIFLISGIPIHSVMSSSINQSIDNDLISSDNVPKWVTGYFIGLIGETNEFGHPSSYIGHIAGYYEKEDFKGKSIGFILKKRLLKY